jgi:hypothetical protein
VDLLQKRHKDWLHLMLELGRWRMTGRFSASVVADLIAGVVFGVMMQMMMAPAPDGSRMPVLAMVGQIVDDRHRLDVPPVQ